MVYHGLPWSTMVDYYHRLWSTGGRSSAAAAVGGAAAPSRKVAAREPQGHTEGKAHCAKQGESLTSDGTVPSRGGYHIERHCAGQGESTRRALWRRSRPVKKAWDRRWNGPGKGTRMPCPERLSRAAVQSGCPERLSRAEQFAGTADWLHGTRKRDRFRDFVLIPAEPGNVSAGGLDETLEQGRRAACPQPQAHEQRHQARDSRRACRSESARCKEAHVPQPLRHTPWPDAARHCCHALCERKPQGGCSRHSASCSGAGVCQCRNRLGAWIDAGHASHCSGGAG